MTTPRIAARKSKIRDLTPDQRSELERLLYNDGAKYAAVRARMLAKFGVSLGISTICRFWSQNNAPRPPKTAVPAPDSQLDVVIRTAPVRVVVKQQGTEITITKLPCT
jgi:hypothetical protein